jgi:hypothetical protein
MTITFENDNDFIVYAFEKVIAYARRTNQVFVAQCIWWLVSIIGLERGLTDYIDNQIRRAELVPRKASKPEVSPTPRDIQEDSRIRHTESHIHPDRLKQCEYLNLHVSDLDLNASESRSSSGVIDSVNTFRNQSRKERETSNKKIRIDQLSRTKSGKVFKRPLTTGQYKYLQSIPKDTIGEYLKKRK